MNDSLLSRCAGYASRVALILLRNFGQLGLVALAFLLASAAIALVLTPRLHERSVALDQALRSASSRAAPRPAPRDVDSDAAIFSASLPAIEANAADMNRLFELAAQSHIRTPRADYRLSKVATSLFLGYEIRIPVTATYVDLRRFTAEALNQLPNLALAGVRFTRPDSSAATLDAELRLVLFYRRQEP